MVRQRPAFPSVSRGGKRVRDIHPGGSCSPGNYQSGGIHAESKTAESDARSQRSRPTPPASGGDPGHGETPNGLYERIFNSISSLGIAHAYRPGEAILELIPLMVVARDLRILAVNRCFGREYGMAPERASGISLVKLHSGSWNEPALIRAIAAVLASRKRAKQVEFTGDFGGAARRTLCVTVSRIRLQKPPRPAALLAIFDSTELRRAESELKLKSEALRRSETELMQLSAMLINSQEAERTRVARELHDELNQKLAMLTVTVDRLQARVREPELIKLLASLRTGTEELMADVRKLAHQLHPSILDHLGLEVALRSYCEDFSARAGIQVKYSVPVPLGEVPSNVALCLYRICQESLRNVAKHSGALLATVKLERGGDDIVLSVQDKGKGFDSGAAGRTGGIGLLSMRERARLVGGSLTIDSHPGRGTKVLVRVPIGKGAQHG